MDEEIICNDCGWIGDSTMLISDTERVDDPCTKCPDCGGDDIEDFE